jgi:hypothetical protein
MFEIEDFRFNPKLRKMLVNYCLRMYEENAIIDDYHLLEEYKLLKRDNMVHVLFEEEYLINYLRDGGDSGQNKG